MGDKPVQDALGMKDMIDIAGQLANEILVVELIQADWARDLMRAL